MTVLAETTAKCVFWVCLLLIVYAYFLYPVVLFAVYSLSQIRRDWQYLTRRCERRVASLTPEQLPPVSLIFAAYNEKRCLQDKIANIRELDYPRDKLEVVIVSDGSIDRTNEILRDLKDPNIRTLILPVRKGKSNALNQAVALAQHDILVFSDASTLHAPGAVKNLARHFSDPSVGVVCGAIQMEGNAESEQTEGVYMKYENLLRLMEGRLGATVTASGAIYAVRRECYRPLAPNKLFPVGIDDLLIPLNARKLGYRIFYDPEAVATDFSADSVGSEFTRRVRLAASSFPALKEIAHIPLWSLAGVAFFSHKLLRWFLPFLLIGLLLSNSFLLSRPLYQPTFLFQVVFYLWAGLGFLFQKRIRRVRYALVAYFLVAVHVAFLVGFWCYLSGRGDSSWQRAN